MHSVLLQTIAVSKMNLKSVPQRFWISFSTVLAVALVVMVLLAFLAMANGFQQTLTSSGANDVAVLLREGARAEISSVISREQVHLLEESPGIAKGADGEPLVSAELYLVVDGIKRASQTKANVPLRGIGPEGGVLRRGITLIEGRMFHRGTNEIVVGKAMMREFQGFELGQTATFGPTSWKIVGAFVAEGSVFESEIWADLPVVQSIFNRNSLFQSFRARLESPEAIENLKRYVENDPRLKLDVKSEAAYFAEHASGTSDLIQMLGWPLAIAMALGALAGALNTMYSAVTTRATEIATLRAIGFGSFSAFAGTLTESLILAAIGGVIGTAASWLIIIGFSASTLAAGAQVVFSFQLSPSLVAQGIALALVVGLIGGLFPAFHAARMPIVAGLYR